MSRVLLASLLVGGLAFGNSQTANTLEIVFGGGYAFILTKKQTLDFATIKKPGIFSQDYVHHPLKLSVTLGYVVPQKTTLPATRIGHGPELGWDFTGRTVEVLSDNASLPAEDVELPVYTPVNQCAASVGNVNNRFFLPDLTRIANQSNLHQEWEQRFDGRITVRGGKLAVTRLAAGCFDFVQDDQKVRTQRVAHGIDGITYSHPVGNFVTLRVSEKGQHIGDVVLIPDGTKVRLAINTRHAGGSMPHRPIKHFKHFYWLLRASVDNKEIPTWLGADSAETTPGEACPPGFYDIP